MFRIPDFPPVIPENSTLEKVARENLDLNLMTVKCTEILTKKLENIIKNQNTPRSDSPDTSTLEKLPFEVISNIFEFLDLPAVGKIAQANRFLRFFSLTHQLHLIKSSKVKLKTLFRLKNNSLINSPSTVLTKNIAAVLLKRPTISSQVKSLPLISLSDKITKLQ